MRAVISSDSSSYSSANDEDEYEVEAIRGVRINKTTGEKEFLIKWKNYDENENSWVLSSDLNCQEIVDEFNEQQRAEKKKKKEDKLPKAKADRGVTETKNKKKKTESAFVEYPLVERETEPCTSKSILQNVHSLDAEISASKTVSPAHEAPSIEVVEVINIVPHSKKISPSADSYAKSSNDVENNVPPPNGKVVSEKRAKASKNVENVVPKNSNVKIASEKRSKQSSDNNNSSSEEERDGDNYVFNAKKVPCKIIETGADTGFSRGWEVEKILAMRNVPVANGEHEKFMIVKFKGYKYAQQLPLSAVREIAPQAWVEFLKDLAVNCCEKNNR